jgi:TfoX/Sxy family transcriptional regulator of competence genes
MPYNEKLASRIELILEHIPGVEAKKMFGGVGFMLQGNMACGVHKDMLVVRVGPDAHDQVMQVKHTRVFDITGKPMSGWVMVEKPGFESDSDLKTWVNRGVKFALTLPPK